MKCYYCRDIKGIKDEELPSLPEGETFCNEQEHELWADKYYGKKGQSKQKLSIEEMQARLKEIGAKVGGQKQQKLV